VLSRPRRRASRGAGGGLGGGLRGGARGGERQPRGRRSTPRLYDRSGQLEEVLREHTRGRPAARRVVALC